MTTVTGAAEQAPPRGPLAPMALAALGVVYGDIGTSPLYTFKTAIAWAGGEATPAAVLGMLSLIVWTLIITTSIKYVAIVMRVVARRCASPVVTLPLSLSDLDQ
jgi:KUP system potassium uptake protein